MFTSSTLERGTIILMKNTPLFLVLGGLVVGGLLILFITPQTETTLPPEQTQEPTFTYPSDFGLTYVHPVDWPPKLTVLDAVVTCTATGDEVTSAGKTEPVQIGGQEYCKTTMSEGAAGSVYHQYVYIFTRAGQVLSLSFTARMPQCVNYDSPQKEVCIEEQEGFNPDTVVADMVSTLK